MSTTPFPSDPTSEPSGPKPLLSVEGLHVVHLYYTVDHGLWQTLSDGEQRRRQDPLSRRWCSPSARIRARSCSP